MNSELKILICLTCRHALKPDLALVVSHFDSAHCGRGETVEKLYPGLPHKLSVALEKFDFASPKNVRVQPHDRAPISGIQVRRGFYCPLHCDDGKRCVVVTGETSTLESHIRTKHQGDKNRPRTDSLESFPCDYQTLFTGNLRYFFRVRTGLTGLETHPDGPRNPYSAFMLQPRSEPFADSYLEPAKYDELPSFLRATRWNLWVEPYRRNPKDVAALIQHPAVQVAKAAGEDSVLETVLCKLQDVTTAWMNTTHSLWEDSSDYSRRVLAHYPM